MNTNMKKFGNAFGIDYECLNTKEITDLTGIPIDEKHRWTAPFSSKEGWILERWTRQFRRQAVPHVVVVVPEVGAIIYMHQWSGDRGRGEWCCDASR